MRNLRILLVAVISISFLASCTPVEEPTVIITTARMKLINEWVPTASFTNDTVVSFDTTYSVTFKEDNTFTYLNSFGSLSGDWILNNASDTITFTLILNGTSTSHSSTILRLTEDELWMKTVNGTDIDVEHFAVKE